MAKKTAITGDVEVVEVVDVTTPLKPDLGYRALEHDIKTLIHSQGAAQRELLREQQDFIQDHSDLLVKAAEAITRYETRLKVLDPFMLPLIQQMPWRDPLQGRSHSRYHHFDSFLNTYKGKRQTVVQLRKVEEELRDIAKKMPLQRNAEVMHLRERVKGMAENAIQLEALTPEIIQGKVTSVLEVR